jgi:WD40 repeat protein/tRNA A-37 threonylcarbamoyl transferase component Bud32
MTYCLNPECQRPLNLDGAEFCQSCGVKLVPLLRNRYRIQRPLGQGGFGKTYLAVDQDRLNTRCVIKQFSPQLKGTKGLEKAIQLFEQEAVRLHELGEHPHIPTLQAYFEQDKRLYLVQQFIEGPTLAQELQHQGPFSEQKIREVLARLLPILKFVHDRNIIHRDITPANIIRRTLDNRLVLIDFGVAKLVTQATSSQPGTRIGTEGYAPIEQLRSGKVYPASDLYSLGATCIYLLTQVKPEDLYDPLRGRWLWREHLAQRGLGMSNGIANILEKMLKDLVSERYQSADEVMHDLRLALAQPPITGERHSNPPTSRGTVTQPPTSSVNQSPSGGVSGQGASGQRPSGNQAPPSRPPVSASSKPPLSGASSFRPCLHTLKGHSSWVVALAISPDCKTVFSGSLDNRILAWEVETGQILRTLTGHTKAVNCLATSPDGQVLLSGSDDDTIKLWQVASGKLVRTLTEHSRDVRAIAVSPDGQYIASGSEDRTVCLWRFNSGELIRRLPGVAGMVRAVVISPNGELIASGGLDNQVKIWHFNNGNLLHTSTGHFNSILALAFSPNSQTLVSSSKDKTIKIWNANTGELIRTLAGHSDLISAVAITPDGTMLLSGSHDKTVKLWNLFTGELLGTLTEHSNSVNSLAISKDGQFFASGSSDNTVKIWQLKI